MIQKIKTYLLTALSVLTLAVPAMVPAAAFAACSNIADQASKGANITAGEGSASTCDSETGVSDGDLGELAAQVVNVFSLVVGAIAIIMIIYGGFRYITSGGASERVGNAKNTLIYAIVGLIIVALAQVIVHFVLNQTGKLAG
jgi:hypothetical protein